jgi:hypothetical protein
VPKSSSVLLGGMVVFVKDAAESISLSDGELVEFLCFGDRWGEWAKGSCGMQGAVGSVVVVTRFEFAQGVQQGGLVKDEGAVEEFGAAGSDPAFYDRVHPWYADPGRDRGDAAVGNNRIDGGGVVAVSVPDEGGHAGVGVLQVHDQVPGHLRNPGCGGVCGGAEDADATGGVFDDGKDEQPCPVRVKVAMKSAASRACAWLRREARPGQVIAVGCGRGCRGF